MTAKTLALTTGQAARYCLVSPDTMVNWIKANNLPAQRTIGGKYRILVGDLRQFMVSNAMSTELLDAELDSRSYCWESCAGATDKAATPNEACCECAAYRTKALNCFELRTINAEGSWVHTDCESCAYFRKWAHLRRDE